MSSCRLMIILVVVLLTLSKGICSSNAQEQENYCARWCGVHKISHPFRLKDSPAKCGDRRYNLSCEDNNRLVLYLGSGTGSKYYVRSIDYKNFTIRLVDANLHPSSNYSLLSPYSLGLYNFSLRHKSPYRVYDVGNMGILVNTMLLVSCPNRVDSSRGVYVRDNATCLLNSNTTPTSYAQGNYFYLNQGSESLLESGLGDGCRIEFMYLTSWPLEIDRVNNISCMDIRRMLFYGFELSWANCFCTESQFEHGWDVSIDRNNQARCVPFPGILQWILQGIPYVIFSLMSNVGALYVMFCGVKFVLGGLCIVVFLVYKWRRRHLSMYDGIEDFLCSDNNIMPLRYSYKDIKKITGQFKTKLGNGGYGSVFKGQLRSGRLVAVKLLDKGKSNGQDFINEVVTIGRIHHVNVVRLIGFCVEGSKRALIYEFMPNGSLEKHIFSHEESSTLSCEKLYSISLGVARGIEYLHSGCNMKILHFDIKPHNILLDENFNPKVSDFGLAKLCPTDKSIISLTAARGTLGYMAPELFYRNVGTISYKADVYSFGMLLMEIASRRKNLNAVAEQSSQIYFPFWVYNELHEGRKITIENDTDEEMKLAKKMMIVALWCIQTKPTDRPLMDKVLEMLEADEKLQMPNKPYFFSQDKPVEDVKDDSISSSLPSSSASISD